MGLSKEKKPRKVWRVLKTLFFLINMVFSLLLASAPVLLVIIDAILPSALWSAFLSPLSLQTLSSQLSNYNFRDSLIDIPLISIARSVVIICVYSFCDGPGLSHGPYLGITTLCSLSSVGFVSLKACVFGVSAGALGISKIPQLHGFPRESLAMEALFLCSLALAVGHIVVAYRTSCRERRKLLIYRIDLEAVSSKNGLPIYHKIRHEVRIK